MSEEINLLSVQTSTTSPSSVINDVPQLPVIKPLAAVPEVQKMSYSKVASSARDSSEL